MIKESTLRTLVKARSINSAVLIGKSGGYMLQVKYGAAESILTTARGEVRLFSLENAGKFLREVGLPVFLVDATNFESGLIRKARPDRAEALRNTRTVMRQAKLIA